MRPARANPFRVQRLHRLRFVPLDTDWPALTARLERLGHRAAIVGPHGSGKTTLLEELAGVLRDRHLIPRRLFFNEEDGPHLSTRDRAALQRLTARDALLVDGYDLLGWAQRRRLRRAAERAAALLVTTHRPCALPTLIRTYTTPDLLGRIVDELLAEEPALRRSCPPARELHRRHRGNLRDALRELYDRAADEGRREEEGGGRGMSTFFGRLLFR